MIQKMLSNENEQEAEYRRLGEWRKIIYHKLVNNIDLEEGNFVVAVDINEESGIGHVIQMHYDDDGNLITDNVLKF